MFGDGFDGFEAVGAFRDNIDIRVRLNKLSQDEAGKIFVINN